MRWEQRKPLWPILVALGLLCLLAVAAPRSWQGYDSRGSKSSTEFAPATDAKPPESDASLVRESKPAESKPDACPSVVYEPLPQRSEFNMDRLLAMRDLLLVVVDQLPTPKPTTSPATSRVPPVRVSSEYDRLAMVPQRVRRERVRRESSNAQRKPLKNTESELENFAEILLRASRYPERNSRPKLPRLPQANTAPRLAMRPTLAETARPAVEATVPHAIIEPARLRHRPLALIKRLESFSASTPGAVWSQQVLAEIRQLTGEPFTDEQADIRPNAAEMLSRLESLHATGIDASGIQPTDSSVPTSHNQWQQAAQALGRRLEIWRLLLDPQQPAITGDSKGLQQTSATLLPVLSEIATLLEADQNGTAWREYLLLDRIAANTSEGLGSATRERRKLAQEVLSRMNDPRLTQAQREFLTTLQFVQLHQELRVWAAGKVNLETLAALIERYETGREMRFAAAIAQLQQRLQWSDEPRLQALGSDLQQHYRGANMRIAMSGDLMNRMVPKQEPIVSPIRDRVAGAKVRGQSRTTTQLRVRLLPDDEAWRFGLEAFGKVYTKTRSDTWPAQVRNAAKMQFQARKVISIDAEGLHIERTQVKAQGRNELVGVDSQLDPIPIFGHLLRGLARKKYDKSRPTIMNQAKTKVVRSVKQRMDSATDRKLEAFEQLFRAKVLAPIEQLTLLAEPLDIHTTEKRAVMQLRLANEGQLAAHTQRPLAPSDSVLSLQMHETVLNNAMMGLGLDGRRMKLPELFDFFAQRFGKSEAELPVDLPRRAVIEFAARDAVRVQCEGDRLQLVLSIAELAHGRDKIKNFQVHVYFRPLVNGLDVRLVRDGTLQFSGRRLKTGPRVVLHSILGKLLVKDQEIELLNAALLEDPRLAGLMVTQLVIEDGWIGLALGPAHARRTAWRAPQPELLETPFVR